jgi:hypothetical protein
MLPKSLKIPISALFLVPVRWNILNVCFATSQLARRMHPWLALRRARKAVTLALERQDEGEKRFATVIKEKVRPDARGADIERLDERKT